MINGICRYGAKCRFAHGDSEVRPIVRHKKYKTELCKNFQKDGVCHYGNRCRFIHNDIDTLLYTSAQSDSVDLGSTFPSTYTPAIPAAAARSPSFSILFSDSTMVDTATPAPIAASTCAGIDATVSDASVSTDAGIGAGTNPCTNAGGSVNSTQHHPTFQLPSCKLAISLPSSDLASDIDSIAVHPTPSTSTLTTNSTDIHQISQHILPLSIDMAQYPTPLSTISDYSDTLSM
uniref:Zinc finger protein 36, C3H1 type-like 1 n=1 Tax=Lygus hesperus TaxID=30085 RepID=A0A0A9WHJ0_LYGHE